MLPSYLEETVGTRFFASVVLERRDYMRNHDAMKLTAFQQNFAAFCTLMTEICISLFYFVSYSKSRTLLITGYAAETNRIQREFLFNNGIQSQNFFSSVSQCPLESNLLKPKRFQAPLSIVSLRTLWGGVGGWGLG
jgi:hypothetical protein